MIIDLREIPIRVLNLSEDVAKRRFMNQQLMKYGLEASFVPGVACEPRAIGCALSHLRALKEADLRPPFLVLEDDCEFIDERFHYTFVVPDEVDALYLGHSAVGLSDQPDRYGLRWGRHRNVRYDTHDDAYIRVYNMLGRHAIVYVSERFWRNAIDAGERALVGLDFPIPGDVQYAELQLDHLVLAARDPL